MKPINKQLAESLATIKIATKDHHHFTNLCCICRTEQEDHMMVPIKIERRSGLDSRLYIENDYACSACLQQSKE